MPTSAVTGTHSIRAAGAKLPKAPNDNGFHRTRSVTKDDGTVVIQELWGKTWVDVEERPKTNG